MSKRDTLYQHTQSQGGDFQFDETVAQVFPDMIKRSVPGYSHIIANCGVLAQHYVRPHTQVYDLGSSLGATTLAMRQRIKAEDVRIIAVDSSEAMLKRSHDYLDTQDSSIEVQLTCADICELDYQQASFVTLNFTLQFIEVAKRATLLSRIYDGMIEGGALVLSEKLVFDEPEQQALLETHQLNFKRANGYSELEISQKRSAIENVLIPETYETHKARLHQAGFRQVELWFQCFNFVSILAVK